LLPWTASSPPRGAEPTSTATS
ncbi:hypothetical protein EJB05_03450, partial [Eragrostis curvula]